MGVGYNRIGTHETKTRYVDFRRRRPYGRHWMASATTFDFLGFTHVWGRSMQGKDVVRQITAKGRFARALKSVHDWCKRHRHLPIEAGEASVAAWMGKAIEHRKSDGPGCRGFQIGRRQYRRRRFGEMSASPAVSENPCTFARLLLGPWEVFKLPRLS